MATSQNGYAANDVNLTSSRLIPGTDRKIRVRKGAAGDLLLWVASQFDRSVEDIDPGILDDWGYAERPIRGGVTLSNHASGTAIDLNATRHPLGTDPRDNFTPGQIGVIRTIVNATEGCVRWGGDYTGRKDPMHFEIVRDEAACARALARLNGGGGGGAGGGGTPSPGTGKILMTEENMTTLPPAPTTSYEVLPVPPDANVKLIFAAKTTIFGGNIFNWSPVPGQGTGGNPKQWRTEVQEGEAIAIPRGTSKVHIEYSCASPVHVYIQAIA